MPTVRGVYCRTLSPREPLSYVSTPILRFGAWSPWSHVALVMGDEPGKVIDATWAHKGVQRRELADLLADSSQYKFRDFEVPNPQATYDFARSQLGMPYDVWGAIGLGLHRDWQETGRWWCSELFECALAAGGLVRFMGDARRVSQQDSYKVAAGVILE